jgi:hypothetical protein
MGQSPKDFGGEGGKKVRAAQASYARSQNICPLHLIRDVAMALCVAGRATWARLQSEKTSSQKEE